jgi:hypothetical protein
LSKEFQPYLDQVTRHVERDPGLVFEIQSELRTHLQCAADEFEAQGFSHDDAVEESLKAFGDPAQLALEFKSTYAGRPVIGQGLRFVAIWLAFPLAFLAVHLAWTGIRESWWHQSSGWYGAPSLISQIKSSPQPPAAFVPDQEQYIRENFWKFYQPGYILQIQGLADRFPSEANPIADSSAASFISRGQSHGYYQVVMGALYYRSAAGFNPGIAKDPEVSFEPWRMDNRFNAQYWATRQRQIPEVGRNRGYELLQAHPPAQNLASSLKNHRISDASVDFWTQNLQSQSPKNFQDLVRRYGALFAARGLGLSTVAADQFIRTAQLQADMGDFDSARATLDQVDALVARQLSEAPQDKSILPLAIYRLIYLPDCRQGILGDKSGPGPDPAAMAALSHELAPFQSHVFLPGINPHHSPMPPGAWARVSGWASLTNNLLVITLACLILLLAGAWLVWAFGAVLASGIISSNQAPGLLPRPVTRIALPAGLLLWGTLAVFFAGLFANPSMRLEAQVWMAYPGLILLSGMTYMAFCIAINRRQVALRSGLPAPTPADISAGRFFIAYTLCFNVMVLTLCLNPRTVSQIPAILVIPASSITALAGYLARRKYLALSRDHQVRILIQTRSLRLALGLAVACISLACLALYLIESGAAWAAWKSNALPQPLSQEFKHEVLGQ